MAARRELTALSGWLAAVVGLKGPGQPVGGAVDWQGLWDLIREHDLAPFLAARRRDWPRAAWLASPPSWVETAFCEHLLASGAEACFAVCERRRVLSALAPFRPVLLKGAALLEVLYERAAERPMSDLDVLIERESDYAEAAERLEALGYHRSAARRPPRHHHGPPLIDPLARTVVELHHLLGPSDSTPPALTAALRARAEVVEGRDGQPVRVLDRIGRALHHALHAVQDPIDSAFLRNLFELAWMLERMEPGERLEMLDLARAHRVEDRVGCAVALAREQFGSPDILPVGGAATLARWCRRRLGWTHAPDREVAGTHGLTVRVATRYLESVRRGAGARSPVPVATSTVRVLLRFAWASLRRPLRALGRRRPVPHRALPVGRGMLVWNASTGAVHLLDRWTAAAWEEFAHRSTPTRVVRSRLRRLGADGRVARLAVARLCEEGLLEG